MTLLLKGHRSSRKIEALNSLLGPLQYVSLVTIMSPLPNQLLTIPCSWKLGLIHESAQHPRLAQTRTRRAASPNSSHISLHKPRLTLTPIITLPKPVLPFPVRLSTESLKDESLSFLWLLVLIIPYHLIAFPRLRTVVFQALLRTLFWLAISSLVVVPSMMY